MRKIIINLKFWIALIVIQFFSQNINAQVGNLIWEDNFNTLNSSIWNADVGNGCEIGLCGWGNAELEYYREENLSIESVPGESGNNALVMEAKRESFGGFEFTSGKVTSEGNLSVHYGMIEIRMQTPDVDTGLWPAAWLLGTANLSWPAKGEIDMMEMGHRVEEITNQGHEGTNQNNYVGANAIFANEDGSVGSIAYDVNYNKPYVASSSMANRFMTYRLYWEPTELRLTVVDNGVEYDLYEGPLPLSNDSVTSAFQKPFFFLMNLAVGGNFTDAATSTQVTAPLPSKLYIDYVRVYEWNGYGSVELDYNELVAETGPFGVYTEDTPVNNSLSFGLDSEIYVWGETMQDGTTEAYEGNEVIAWETLNANSWFGGGIASTFGRDMSGYVEEGVLKFNIKIPADVSFRIGVTDNYTNESWITFNANEEQYGLVRNGEWGQVEIPLVDFAGLIAFQNINYMFAIASVDGAFPVSTVQLGIDNIVWDDGNPLTNDIDVTGVSVSPTDIILLEGETSQLSATVAPSDATNQNISWSSSDESIVSVEANGLVTANSEGSTVITVTTEDGSFTATISVTVSSESGIFTPDPTKTYYIDVPIHNLRLAATGESEDAYTTSTTTTGDDVTWQFVAKGNGYWHIQRVAGGSTPRLRTDNSQYADMQGTAWSGTYTYYEFAEGFTEDTYFVTLPDGPTNYKRLQVNNSGEVKMVSTASNRTWESFTFTEVSEDTNTGNTDLFIEAENYTSMEGVQTEESDDDDTLNVGWIDINDWLEYEITVATAGTYNLDLRVASPNSGAATAIEVDGATQRTVDIPTTGNWQIWETVNTFVDLSAGTQTLRLTSTGNGWNINWLEINSQASAKSTISKIALEKEIKLYPNPVTNQLNLNLANYEEITSVDIIDLKGQRVIKDKIIGSNIITFNTSNLSNGLYLVRIKSSDGVIAVKKFIK